MDKTEYLKTRHSKNRVQVNHVHTINGKRFFLFMCLLFSTAACLSAERDKEVIVEGFAFVKGLPDSGVIEMAREAARRRAIEVAGETILERHSETENFQLLKDCLIVDTRGLVKKQDWLLYPNDKEFEIRDDRLFVKLRATVRVGRIENDLPAIAEVLRVRGQPRFAMLVREETGAGRDQGVTAGEIEALFIDKGFRVIDADAAAGIMDRETDELFDNPEAAAALARRLSADYAIIGLVRATREEPYEDEGVAMVRHGVTVRFTVVDNHLGGKSALVQQAFHTRPTRLENAGNQLQDSLLAAGRNIAPELLSRVLDRLGRQTGFIEIVVSNADRDKLDRLRETLRKMGGKQNFVTRSMRRGHAAVEFESQFSIDAVASYIDLQVDAPLELISQIESKLVCEFE